MGGLFSTRWDLVHVRPHTDPLPALDVRWLGRIGALTPGAISTPQWSRHGESAGWITTICEQDGDSLILEYATRTGSSEWVPVREAIALESMPCHYGGERTWFLCPGCRSRRAVLFAFGGHFRCRACHGLAYSSTRENAAERSLRRLVVLTRKLSGDQAHPACTIPPRPRGMHYRTYLQLAKQMARDLDVNDALPEAFVAHLEPPAPSSRLAGPNERV